MHMSGLVIVPLLCRICFACISVCNCCREQQFTVFFFTVTVRRSCLLNVRLPTNSNVVLSSTSCFYLYTGKQSDFLTVLANFKQTDELFSFLA